MSVVSLWPFSELTKLEADRILALPPKQRDKDIAKLKREIADGTLARRKRMREAENA